MAGVLESVGGFCLTVCGGGGPYILVGIFAAGWCMASRNGLIIQMILCAGRRWGFLTQPVYDVITPSTNSSPLLFNLCLLCFFYIWYC